MYIYDRQLKGPETKPVTSGPEFQAEMEEYKKLKERREALRKEHEKRLAPPPLDLFPIDVFKRAGVTATTRVGKTTASLIQSSLERSRALRPYIAQKLMRVMIPKKFIHHNFPETFDDAYTRLHKIVIPKGSAEEKELKTKRGFFHPPTDSIHLRPDSNVGDALHEAIHKFSSPGFREALGGYVDEGVTQYFTDVVLVEQGLGKMTTHLYQDQLRCANQLIGFFSPDIVAKAYFQGVDLNDLARNLVSALNTNLKELATRLKKGDALCQRIVKAQRTPAGSAPRSQPLAYARGAAPRGAFIGRPPKAAPTISKAGADRINRVSKTMTQALRLAEEALPFLKTSAQKELLKQMVGGIGTFFPTGFGIFNEKGEAVKAPARLRFETNIRQPGGAISRVYIYDARLFMSDQHSPSAAGDHRAIGDRASQIRLYARQLASTRPQELVGVAIHEMTHMLRAIVRSFVGRFGSAAAGEFPWREAAPLLDFSRLDSHRAKMEAHFARLIAVLEKQANVRFDANFAAFRAGQLLEEVLAHVFTARIGEAMAEADASKKAKKGTGRGVGVSLGFEPMGFLNHYISSHWFSETALISALKSPQAQSVIRGMSDDLRAIVGAMETQVGP